MQSALVRLLFYNYKCQWVMYFQYCPSTVVLSSGGAFNRRLTSCRQFILSIVISAREYLHTTIADMCLRSFKCAPPANDSRLCFVGIGHRSVHNLGSTGRYNSPLKLTISICMKVEHLAGKIIIIGSTGLPPGR